MQTDEHTTRGAAVAENALPVPANAPGFAPLLLPAGDAFRAIGVGRTKGYALITAGALVARKIGSRTMVETDSLYRFVSSLPTLPARRPER